MSVGLTVAVTGMTVGPLVVAAAECGRAMRRDKRQTYHRVCLDHTAEMEIEVYGRIVSASVAAAVGRWYPVRAGGGGDPGRRRRR